MEPQQHAQNKQMKQGIGGVIAGNRRYYLLRNTILILLKIRQLLLQLLHSILNILLTRW